MIQLVDCVEGFKEGRKVYEELHNEMLGALSKAIHTWTLLAEAMEIYNAALEEVMMSLYQNIKQRYTNRSW